MGSAVAVRHNFEAAHRLPQLGDKCANLHGHSWWVQVEVGAAALPPSGVLVDFGALKAALRQWIDTQLDHGTMLGYEDPLLPALREAGCKVLTFGLPGKVAADLHWPTVENVAVLLGRVAGRVVNDLADRAEVPLQVHRVTVTETSVNQGTWTPP